MQLTFGAIAALKAGAKRDEEVNAVDADGTAFDAGQICAVKDGLVRRKQIDYNEYQPNLMVKEVKWSLTNRLGVPMKTWIVVDDEEAEDDSEMVMMAATRTKEVHQKFLKQWGQSGKNCKLSIGRRFTLVDYTTVTIAPGKQFSVETPVIMVEKLRMEPKSRHQTKIASFLSKNKVPECQSDDSVCY